MNLRDAELVAAGFGLGRLESVTPLARGGPGVMKLTTPAGVFIAKPAGRAGEAELHERVSLALTESGIRQARLRRSLSGSLVGGAGHTVQEFLTGRVCLAPTAAQTAATMRHVTAYHVALTQVPPPAALRADGSLWHRVASAGYLVRELPGLLADRHSWPGPQRPVDTERPVDADGSVSDGSVTDALAEVTNSLDRMRRLPRQLVHGDIGPDNVLMDGDEVQAIIDFTPHHQPFLFALATAVYWYHVYGRYRIDLDAIGASLAATAGQRPWTSLEAALWPAMLAREALRRLATPLAIAAAKPTGVPSTADESTTAPPAVGPRYAAVGAVMRAWPGLAGLAPR